MYMVVVVVWPLSHVHVFATPWTVACQAPLSMEFPRQENWSGLSFSSLGDLPNQWIEPASSALQVDYLLLSHQGSPLYLSAKNFPEWTESTHITPKEKRMLHASNSTST